MNAVTLTPLDLIIQRLQAVPGIAVQGVNPSGDVFDWKWFETSELIGDLVITPDLRTQVDVIQGQIMAWGRIVAVCRRVWQVREREYRVWRSHFELDLLKAGTKMTVAQTEASYRVTPEYAKHQTLIEQAEESYNAASAVYEAFRAKKDMLRADVRPAADGTLSRWSV